MNKLIPTVLVLLACSLALLMPVDECDADTHYVQFHDEFHGDFWMKTDYQGYLSYEQLQDPRLVPTQEGYEFKGWFLEDGREFGAAMKITSDLQVTACYEKIETDSWLAQNALYIVLILVGLSCVGVVIYMMRKGH